MKKSAKLFLCMMLLVFSLAVVGCSSGSGSDASASTASSPSASEMSSSAVSSASQSGESVSASQASQPSQAPALEKGTYSVQIETDSTMFHINEADKGLGELTVSDDGMTVHIRLASKKITVLYAGLAEQAQADEAGWIQPSTDTVTYDDGYTEEVYGFDVPVPALDEPFDVAILGSKGNWYDHKVTVSSPKSE